MQNRIILTAICRLYRQEALIMEQDWLQIGQNFDECKPYFGESVVIKNSLFFYPAMNNPNVDFMLSLDPELDFNYNFLHGFFIQW